jgi:hypothetical protein
MPEDATAPARHDSPGFDVVGHILLVFPAFLVMEWIFHSFC